MEACNRNRTGRHDTHPRARAFFNKICVRKNRKLSKTVGIHSNNVFDPELTHATRNAYRHAADRHPYATHFDAQYRPLAQFKGGPLAQMVLVLSEARH